MYSHSNVFVLKKRNTFTVHAVHIYERRYEYRVNGILHSPTQNATVIWNKLIGSWYRSGTIFWNKQYKPVIKFSLDLVNDHGFVACTKLCDPIPLEYPIYSIYRDLDRDTAVDYDQSGRKDYYYRGVLHRDTGPSIEFHPSTQSPKNLRRKNNRLAKYFCCHST